MDMLVLSRKVGQELVIGESIRVVITKIVGNRITLGVQAPATVRVLRSEMDGVNRPGARKTPVPDGRASCDRET
jgi:carbon storage regulator